MSETSQAVAGLYRKKPVAVEARRWDGTVAAATGLIDWILACGGTARYHDDPAIAIDTLEGTVCAHPGAWVIRGVAGEFYPCRADIFAATYEPAELSRDRLAAIEEDREADELNREDEDKAGDWVDDGSDDDGLPHVPLGGVVDRGFDAAGGAW